MCDSLDKHGSHMQLKENWEFKENSMCDSAWPQTHARLRDGRLELLSVSLCCKTHIVIQQLHHASDGAVLPNLRPFTDCLPS